MPRSVNQRKAACFVAEESLRISVEKHVYSVAGVLDSWKQRRGRRHRPDRREAMSSSALSQCPLVRKQCVDSKSAIAVGAEVHSLQ